MGPLKTCFALQRFQIFVHTLRKTAAPSAAPLSSLHSAHSLPHRQAHGVQYFLDSRMFPSEHTTAPSRTRTPAKIRFIFYFFLLIHPTRIVLLLDSETVILLRNTNTVIRGLIKRTIAQVKNRHRVNNVTEQCH